MPGITLKRPTDAQERQFHRLFQVRLMRFCHPFFGFDVIAFDQWLGTPEGTSTEDFLTKKYGQEASEFVRSLIDLGVAK